MKLYDIRPKYRNGKKIRYKKKYSELSDRSRRRYRALVDSRPHDVRKRNPIDRIRSAKQRTSNKKLTSKIGTVRRQRRPVIGRKKGYTSEQLRRLAQRGKIPKGALYGYNQWYLPNLAEEEAGSPEIIEDPDELEDEEQEDVEFDELTEEELKKIRLQHIQQYQSIEEALEDQGEEPEYYYSSQGKIHRASFVDKVFYFTPIGDYDKPVPLYKRTPKWMRRK